MLIRSIRHYGLWLRPIQHLAIPKPSALLTRFTFSNLISSFGAKITQIQTILPKPNVLNDLHILTVSTFRRKRTKVGKSKRKQRRRELKRKSVRKQAKANL